MKKYTILLSLLFSFLLGNAQNKYLLKVGTSGYTTAQIDSTNALNLKQLDTVYTGNGKVLTQWKAGQLYYTKTVSDGRYQPIGSSGYVLDTTNRNTGVKTIFQAAKDSLTLRSLINTNSTNVATNTASIGGKLDTGGTYLKTVTLINTGILHNTPTYSYNSATHNYSITQTLATQSAHSLLGTVTAGSPTFIQSIDSTYIPGFHTTSYYDNRYALAASLSNYLPLTGGSVSGRFNVNSLFDIGSLLSTNFYMGFNRNQSNGAVINSSYRAYTLGEEYGNFYLQRFNSDGSFAGNDITVNGSTGATTFYGSVTAPSHVMTGGTASQFQMANGTTATVDGTSITNIAGVLSAGGGSSAAKLDTSGNYINTIAINADALYGAASYSKTFHTGIITQNLNTQSAYQIFGTGSSTATPSFRYIDSMYFNGQFYAQVKASILSNVATANLNINGTGGNGYINLLGQSATPATPASTNQIAYADVSGRFTLMGSNGFGLSVSKSRLTASRVWTYQNKDGVFADSSDLAANSIAIAANTTSIGTKLTIDSTITTLTDGSTITFDCGNSLYKSFTLTLAGTGRTLAFTNAVKNGVYIIKVYQDGTGSRTITSYTNGSWDASNTIPTLTTVASRMDLLTGWYDGSKMQYNITYNRIY